MLQPFMKMLLTLYITAYHNRALVFIDSHGSRYCLVKFIDYWSHKKQFWMIFPSVTGCIKVIGTNQCCMPSSRSYYDVFQLTIAVNLRNTLEKWVPFILTYIVYFGVVFNVLHNFGIWPLIKITEGRKLRK